MNLHKQAIINTLGNVIYLIAIWLLTVIVTRCLGYEAVGKLTLAMTIGNVILMIQNYGVRSFQSSDMSFFYSSKDYISARIVTIIIGWIFCAIACLLLRYSAELSTIITLFVLLKSSEAFSDVLFGNDQRVGRLELAGYSLIFRGVLITALFGINVFLFNRLDIALGIAMAGTVTLTIFGDLTQHNKAIKNKESTPNRGFWGIVKTCFPLLLATLLPAIIIAFPRIVLERFYGTEILGVFGNISAPALLLTTIIPAVLTALMPEYGKAANKKQYIMIRKLWLKSFGIVIITTITFMIGVLLIGEQVLSFVYTRKIIPYIPYLYFVLISMMFYSFTMCSNCVLIALHKNWGLTLLTFSALLICLSVSVPLVHTWGIGGAIAVLAVSYGVQALVQAVWILHICGNEVRP